MSNTLVKKSLYKLLNDNLDIFITYNSNEKNIIDITDIYSQSDIIAPNNQIVLTQLAIPFTTDVDIIGRVLNIENINYSSKITAWDNITSTVTLEDDFVIDLTTSDKITILQQELVYINHVYSLPETNNLWELRHKERWELWIKTKNDENKDKIDKILQDIKNVINYDYRKLDIYDDTLAIVGQGNISNYSEEQIIDSENDIMSFQVTFDLDYGISYK